MLWALTPPNRLACELALATGWRIDDVLELRTKELEACNKKKRKALTITEKKTGKRSTRYISPELVAELLRQSGRQFVFEGRDDYRKHRTRQAVFIDLKKAAQRFNLKINLAPHSLRKNFAVYLREQGKSLAEIQRALNHTSLDITLLYVMSDELSKKYDKRARPKGAQAPPRERPSPRQAKKKKPKGNKKSRT